MEEFRRVHKVGRVDEYMEKFEKAKARLLIENPYFQEPFFVGSFISGLKDEIQTLGKCICTGYHGRGIPVRTQI
jgi:hypothetical protein